MITNEFKAAYKSLNPQQKEAVDEIEGPVMVLAGPGTGKTQILTLRIANILLKTQINPENILALTFSESASYEMRKRLAEIIGTPAFRVEISTFHSFANDIIKNYPDEFPYLLSADSITEIEQLEILERLIEIGDFKILRPFGDPLYYIRDILSAINNLKKEGLSRKELEDALNKWQDETASASDLYHEKGKYKGEMKGKYLGLKKDIEKCREFLKIFAFYEQTLLDEKKYDFSDMLMEAVKVLQKEKDLSLRLQEKYQYILIDEHQDTNSAQNKLVELLSSYYDNPNLFVVGDISQAIYRFQGASLENFLYFKKKYQRAKLINLQKNYRSQQTILDAASSLIEKNISANILPSAPLTSHNKKTGSRIKIAKLSDYNLEYEYVAAEIERLIKRGNNISEIAVLSRRNADLYPAAEVLNKKSIRFVISSDDDVLESDQIRKLILILESLANPFDEYYLSRVMQIDFLGFDPFDLYKTISFSKKEKIDFISALKKNEKFNPFLQIYKGWIKLSVNIPFDDLFVKIIDESGLMKEVLSQPNRYQELDKLTALFNQIKQNTYKNPAFSLSDFLHLLETSKKHKVTISTKDQKTLDGGVRLMTVHKSKGLEFETVFIINFFDSRWGSRKKDAKIAIPWKFLGENIKAEIDFEKLEDERRLLYVGITRAKNNIYLTYAAIGIEGREQLPSQFLQEIDARFLEYIDAAKFEKSFDKKDLFAIGNPTKTSAKNKKYLQNLFLEKGLSVTGLGNFLECPWKYFFRNLVALPDVKSKFLIFGTAIHHALDYFIKVRHFKKINEKILIDKYLEVLDKSALSKADYKELVAKGKKVLINYFHQIIPTWPKDLQSEMHIRGVKFSDQLILNGRLDMVEIVRDNIVRVHDFKTGKPRSRSQIDGSKDEKKYNYLRQLVFYKLLLDRYKSGLFNMTEGVIDFIEPDEKGRFKSEIFFISDTQVKELEKLIKSVGDQIINLTFWDQTCGEKDCEYCKLRRLSF
ncbi:ATP-dependent helicase [Candidatus Daviesbacteria bacterium]|nr:ATP-dependent helicase [Candidatus Daviesbacteria bacterium]